MIGSIRIRFHGPVPGSANLTQREWNALKKEAFNQVGLWWFRECRPKHFTAAGATEYAYAPRVGERGRPGPKGFKQSYTGRKLKDKGHTRPLVYTGKSMADAAKGRVEPTFKRVRVIMNVPTLSLRPRGGQIDMQSELRRLSARDIKDAVRLHGRSMIAQLRAIRTTCTLQV